MRSVRALLRPAHRQVIPAPVRKGCDTGPKDPPKPFTKCCSGRGSCVAKDLVPAADVALLGKDTCAEHGPAFARRTI